MQFFNADNTIGLQKICNSFLAISVYWLKIPYFKGFDMCNISFPTWPGKSIRYTYCRDMDPNIFHRHFGLDLDVKMQVEQTSRKYLASIMMIIIYKT